MVTFTSGEGGGEELIQLFVQVASRRLLPVIYSHSSVGSVHNLRSGCIILLNRRTFERSFPGNNFITLNWLTTVSTFEFVIFYTLLILPTRIQYKYICMIYGIAAYLNVCVWTLLCVNMGV